MSKLWPVARTVFLRLRFIFVLIAIALTAGNWPWIVSRVNRWTGGVPAAVVDSGYEWFCPMDPSVVRDDDREKCPICHMALGKRRRGAGRPSGKLQLSPQRILQAGIATEEIRYRPLTREIRTVGQVEWDERKFARISARAAGRVDELQASFVGFRVRLGEPVCRLYSPAAASTFEQYVHALNDRDSASRQPAPGDRSASVLASARERLKALGVTDERIAELERTREVPRHLTVHSQSPGIVIKKDVIVGQYVQPGEDLCTIADDSRVWVQAHVFERDLGMVREGLPVEITAEAHPGQPFSGSVAFVPPLLEARTRTAKVRVEIPNPEGRLRIGMYVTAVLRIPPPPEKRPAVPLSAVIDTGLRKVVFVERGAGVFESVEIEVGPRALAPRVPEGPAEEYYPVLRGLAAGERVATAGAFLLDAEAQLTRSGALYFGSCCHEIGK